MFQKYIGRRSDPVANIVEQNAVRQFAEAIGGPHPIYVDEEYGKRSRYGRNIAPPTFPRVFDYGMIEGFHLPNEGLIHGEQSFQYRRPLYVGETICCSTEIKNYNERAGSSGTLGFLVIEDIGKTPEGETIFFSTSTVIITEAVKERWNQ
ncbi:MaoC family dehydratase N-terminal domain-containing protein [Bacillus sp. KH172YL63]|uniref:MaoC family dehydratase N-terminal domain-containing protein n=1 Tax=Bacillus sp. KH172YL63 TaxID=2709784 RepID=UPI0013E501FB|nr:MaoC family dehydratase N-terminal domain-containing protein [Bacillus sp. KH172YL63]BCB03816.1 hypothetical protein KH172YL63_19490 [Bacillus sp. KH172YL63]